MPLKPILYIKFKRFRITYSRFTVQQRILNAAMEGTLGVLIQDYFLGITILTPYNQQTVYTEKLISFFVELIMVYNS